jgi:uncharacterized protein (TIGR04222 family)
MYERTLCVYRNVFGEEPPEDIWPAPEVRFGTDLSHRVVNTSRNWVVPKAPVMRAAALLTAASIALTVMGCTGGWNPFDLVGVEFLGFLLPMMIAAVIVGRLLRWHARRPATLPGDEDWGLTWEEAAYLNGGYPRLTTAAVARLVASGTAQVSGDNTTLVHGDTPLQPGALTLSEAGVYDCLPLARTPEELRSAQSAVETRFAAEAGRLEDDGLVMTIAQRLNCVVVSVVPVALVLVFLGLPRLILGVLAHRPVGYLVATIFIGGFVGVVLSAVGVLRLSRRGAYLLSQTRARHLELQTERTWHEHHDVGMALALFGTSVLAGSSLAPLAAWYPRPITASSGGCGGDGCGGCGGGG